MSTPAQNALSKPGDNLPQQDLVATTFTEGTNSASSAPVGEQAVENQALKELPAKPKTSLCGVCEGEKGKYKCPKCSLP